MKRRVVGHQVAEKLIEAEAAIDAAIRMAASLAAFLPEARTTAGLSAVIGQGAFDRTSSVLSALVLARREIVGVHGELAEVKDQVGLRHVALGGEDKPPGIIQEVAELRAANA